MNEEMNETVAKAYEDLRKELLGNFWESIDITTIIVDRDEYTEALHKVQEKHGLKQGHPAFIEWLFTCIAQSPKIIEKDEEGAGNNEPTTN